METTGRPPPTARRRSRTHRGVAAAVALVIALSGCASCSNTNPFAEDATEAREDTTTYVGLISALPVPPGFHELTPNCHSMIYVGEQVVPNNDRKPV
jgi:hypothetical protein